uniref:General transcription factor II-I repeat domain-containing protein 2B n=1 Tax=Melanaphis sacchari TaxID=742174 RepID=A0A2H8TZF9_9HEMI
MFQPIQIELIKIQNDSNLKNKFNEAGVPDFYNFLPIRYVETCRFACKIISMFSNTYLSMRGATFIINDQNSNKSAVRSRLTDTHLNALLKVVSSNNISLKIEKLVGEKTCQILSKTKLLI